MSNSSKKKNPKTICLILQKVAVGIDIDTLLGLQNHKQTYFVNDPSDKSLINYLKTHIGLEIEITNRGINRPATRRRWMQSQLNSLEERIERKVEAI